MLLNCIHTLRGTVARWLQTEPSRHVRAPEFVVGWEAKNRSVKPAVAFSVPAARALNLAVKLRGVFCDPGCWWWRGRGFGAQFWSKYSSKSLISQSEHHVRSQTSPSLKPSHSFLWCPRHRISWAVALKQSCTSKITLPSRGENLSAHKKKLSLQLYLFCGERKKPTPAVFSLYSNEWSFLMSTEPTARRAGDAPRRFVLCSGFHSLRVPPGSKVAAASPSKEAGISWLKCCVRSSLTINNVCELWLNLGIAYRCNSFFSGRASSSCSWRPSVLYPWTSILYLGKGLIRRKSICNY